MIKYNCMRENKTVLEEIKVPDKIQLPKEVKETMQKLDKGGFKAFVVGGGLRDILLSRDPKDWDIATNAEPEQIQEIFPDSFYENTFGTVGIKTDSKKEELKVIEVTTFRIESDYTDKRHPDSVHFAKTIEEDLSRRDFTINAMAWDGKTLIDPYGGQKDLKKRTIRTVGDADRRFQEDALRLMRAIRFGSELNFVLDSRTAESMHDHAGLLEFISKERIGDEFRKLIMTTHAARGIELLRDLKMLKFVLPELEEGWDVDQNKHHIYTVWEHNVRALQYATEQGYSFDVRLAALLHDVGKPRSKRGTGPDSTFYGHEVIGAKLAARALERLHFSKKEIEKISLLVRAHMFNYDPNVVTDASVRRLIAKVGEENIKDLVQVREADRIGSGVKKAVPYKLRHFMFRIEKVLAKPVSRKTMKLDGNELMTVLKLEAGPHVGAILEALFEEILDDPGRNKKDYLVARAKELNEMSDKELGALRKKAQDKYASVLEYEEGLMKDKYGV